MGRLIVALAAAVLVAHARFAVAVDGVIEINQARAVAGGVTPGDQPGFPVTIDATGSYRLTGNLTNETAGQAVIELTTGCTLDLNGFEIRHNGTGISGSSATAVVMNGSIRGTSSIANFTGISLGGGSRVERLNVTSAVRLVELGPNSRVTNSTLANGNNKAVLAGDQAYVANNSITGFYAQGFAVLVGERSIIKENIIDGGIDGAISAGARSIITDNAVDGFHAAIGSTGALVQGNVVEGGGVLCSGCVLIGNRVEGANGVGFAGENSSYVNNQFNDNNGGNANAQVSGNPIEMGVNVCGGDTTCP